MIVDIEFNSAAQVPSPGILQAAVLADGKDFGATWKGESNSRDPTVVIASIAARTTRIGLGMSVYNIFGRSPITSGIQAATLNELSGGRFILGLGVAGPALAAWHGQTYEKPIRQMREYVDLVRKVYAREKIDSRGAYFSSHGFKMAFGSDHPLRIYLAALGPQMTRLAGALGEGMITNMALPEVVAENAERARAGARDAGRDPAAFEVVTKVRAAVNPDLGTARAALKRILAFYSLAAGYKEMLSTRMGLAKEVRMVHETWQAKGFKEAARQIPDETLDAVPMVAATSTAQVRRYLHPYFAAGADRVSIVHVPCTDDPVAEALNFVRSW